MHAIIFFCGIDFFKENSTVVKSDAKGLTYPKSNVIMDKKQEKRT